MTLKEKIIDCIAKNIPNKYKTDLITKIEEIFQMQERYRPNKDDIIKLHDNTKDSHRVLTEGDSQKGDDARTKHFNKK